MIKGLSPSATASAWIILLATLLLGAAQTLWLTGAAMLLLVVMALPPARLWRWLLRSVAVTLAFGVALGLGRGLAGSDVLRFTTADLARLAGLGLAMAGALGLGEALRHRRLAQAVVWRLGGALAAFTMATVAQQRTRRLTPALASALSRGYRPERLINRLARLTSHYWGQAPRTALSLATRGYGSRRLSPPGFPPLSLRDLMPAALALTTVLATLLRLPCPPTA